MPCHIPPDIFHNLTVSIPKCDTQRIAFYCSLVGGLLTTRSVKDRRKQHLTTIGSIFLSNSIVEALTQSKLLDYTQMVGWWQLELFNRLRRHHIPGKLAITFASFYISKKWFQCPYRAEVSCREDGVYVCLAFLRYDFLLIYFSCCEFHNSWYCAKYRENSKYTWQIPRAHGVYSTIRARPGITYTRWE